MNVFLCSSLPFLSFSLSPSPSLLHPSLPFLFPPPSLFIPPSPSSSLPFLLPPLSRPSLAFFLPPFPLPTLLSSSTFPLHPSHPSSQDSSKPPHWDALKRMLSLSQLIPVNQDLLAELESHYTAAKTWVDKASQVFLKKNTSGFLLEVQRAGLRLSLSHGCIVASFRGLPTVQFSIICSMQKRNGKAWSILPRE